MEWHALGWFALALYAGAEVLSILSLLKPGGASAGAVLRGSGVAVLLGAGPFAQFADPHPTVCALPSVPYRTFGGAMSLFAWMLGVSYAALLFRHRDRSIGPFLIPFV